MLVISESSLLSLHLWLLFSAFAEFCYVQSDLITFQGFLDADKSPVCERLYPLFAIESLLSLLTDCSLFSCLYLCLLLSQLLSFLLQALLSLLSRFHRCEHALKKEFFARLAPLRHLIAVTYGPWLALRIDASDDVAFKGAHLHVFEAIRTMC